MSDTPVFDELMNEEHGEPLVTIWYVDTKGVVTAEGRPRFETQLLMALALDDLSTGDKAHVSLMAENQSIGWWSQRHQYIEHVEPWMTAEAIVLSEQIEDDLRFTALKKAVEHSAFSPRAG